MPTPEQFQAAQDRELEGIRAALERALEVNAEVLAALGKGRNRKSRRNKKHRRKGTRARRRSRRH